MYHNCNARSKRRTFYSKAIRQLLSQDYRSDRFEIIVADGNSTDRTREIVRLLSKDHPQVKLFPNPKQRSSSGRNLGFKNGRGDFFLVIDGHCLLPNNQLLKNVARLFIKSRADCLGRPQPFVVPPGPTWQRAIALTRASKIGHSSSSYIHSDEEGFASPISMGCAYTRRVFDAIGFVDESFDACEDVEFNYRVEKAGFKTYFSPRIGVRYFPRDSLAKLWQQLSRYGEGRAKFILKHPQTFSWEILVPMFFAFGMMAGPLMLFIFKPFFWMYFFFLMIYLGIISVNANALRKGESFDFLIKLILSYMTIHVSIGFGMIKGFFKRGFEKLLSTR